MNIEIMRNTLYKAYLDDFQTFARSLGGATSEVTGDLLAFEVGGGHCHSICQGVLAHAGPACAGKQYIRLSMNPAPG